MKAEIHLRQIDAEVAQRIKQGARARGWTVGHYVQQLEKLLQQVQDDTAARVGGNRVMRDLLKELGLEELRV